LQAITTEAFESEVLRSPIPVLVEFTAEWCAPCRQLEPVLVELAREWEGRIKIVTYDVDQDPKFVLKHRIFGVPTLVLYVEGQAKERITGFRPKGHLVKKFGRYLASE